MHGLAYCPADSFSPAVCVATHGMIDGNLSLHLLHASYFQANASILFTHGGRELYTVEASDCSPTRPIKNLTPCIVHIGPDDA